VHPRRENHRVCEAFCTDPPEVCHGKVDQQGVNRPMAYS
jgi:hypothetical protein